MTITSIISDKFTNICEETEKITVNYCLFNEYKPTTKMRYLFEAIVISNEGVQLPVNDSYTFDVALLLMCYYNNSLRKQQCLDSYFRNPLQLFKQARQTIYTRNILISVLCYLCGHFSHKYICTTINNTYLSTKHFCV